jgi:hypothetical protein
MYGRRYRRNQCRICHLQTTVKCRNDHGSHLAPRFLRRRSLLGEKQYLPLSKWVQVFYLAADATTGIYSLFLIRDPPGQLQLHCKARAPPEA